MGGLNKYLDFLDTYRGRDKVLRTLCYTSKCASGLMVNQDVCKRLDNFSSQLSACRAALRLLDDIPMLAYVHEYALGQKEKDEYVRYANLLSNVVDLVFYPIDHIAWAIDHEIIPSTNSKWSTASTICWAISLYLTIAKSMRGLFLISQEKYKLNQSNTEDLAKLCRKQRDLKIAAIRAAGDLIFAIHYLPNGFLWAGLLKKWQIGALGSFSSLLGLYQSFS